VQDPRAEGRSFALRSRSSRREILRTVLSFALAFAASWRVRCALPLYRGTASDALRALLAPARAGAMPHTRHSGNAVTFQKRLTMML
jgi:hypothetical protein